MEIVVTVIPTAYALLEVTKNAIHDEARGPQLGDAAATGPAVGATFASIGIALTDIMVQKVFALTI